MRHAERSTFYYCCLTPVPRGFTTKQRFLQDLRILSPWVIFYYCSAMWVYYCSVAPGLQGPHICQQKNTHTKETGTAGGALGGAGAAAPPAYAAAPPLHGGGEGAWRSSDAWRVFSCLFFEGIWTRSRAAYYLSVIVVGAQGVYYCSVARARWGGPPKSSLG